MKDFDLPPVSAYEVDARAHRHIDQLNRAASQQLPAWCGLDLERIEAEENVFGPWCVCCRSYADRCVCNDGVE